ncbi:MAG: hypothetical protein WBL90_00200, partial [bacterium]
AQRESTCLASRGSAVRIRSSPPLSKLEIRSSKFEKREEMAEPFPTTNRTSNIEQANFEYAP